MLSGGRWTDDVTTLASTLANDPDAAGKHLVSVEAEVDPMHVDLIRTRACREDAAAGTRIALFPGARFEVVTLHEMREGVFG